MQSGDRQEEQEDEFIRPPVLRNERGIPTLVFGNGKEIPNPEPFLIGHRGLHTDEARFGVHISMAEAQRVIGTVIELIKTELSFIPLLTAATMDPSMRPSKEIIFLFFNISRVMFLELEVVLDMDNSTCSLLLNLIEIRPSLRGNHIGYNLCDFLVKEATIKNGYVLEVPDAINTTSSIFRQLKTRTSEADATFDFHGERPAYMPENGFFINSKPTFTTIRITPAKGMQYTKETIQENRENVNSLFLTMASQELSKLDELIPTLLNKTEEICLCIFACTCDQVTDVASDSQAACRVKAWDHKMQLTFKITFFHVYEKMVLSSPDPLLDTLLAHHCQLLLNRLILHARDTVLASLLSEPTKEVLLSLHDYLENTLRLRPNAMTKAINEAADLYCSQITRAERLRACLVSKTMSSWHSERAFDVICFAFTILVFLPPELASFYTSMRELCCSEAAGERFFDLGNNNQGWRLFFQEPQHENGSRSKRTRMERM
jgi:hypothetical protein